jgi:ATP-dependent exoDNAse (exonuclease V) beta subunit
MTIADSAQRRTALDPLRSFCVTAPAGSGKTELLIQRYLLLLARVEKPEQVLAITFTRKAAAEMRQRVVEALLSAQDERPCGNQHEQTTRELAHRVLAADREMAWQLTRDINRINIKTIDSFCGGLVRQMPVLSEFGGQAAILDNAQELYREAVSELLAELGRDNPVAEDLRALLRHFDNNWQRMEDLLVSMLQRREQWRHYVGLRHSPQEAEAHLLRTLRSLVEGELATLADALGAFASRLLDLQQYAASHLAREPLAGFPGVQPADLPQWRALRDLLLTRGGSWRRSVDKRAGFPAGNEEQKQRKQDLYALIDEMRALPGVEKSLASLDHLPESGQGETSWQLVVHLFHVLPRLAAGLLLVFARRGQVDHSQVTMSALQALGEDEDPTELALRLDYRIEHILVDEFQDTSSSQFELVHRLTRGWGSHNAIDPGAPRTVMIVGDGMQSIYGFRNANVGLFLKAREEGFNGVVLEPLQLLCNFRSDAGVVDWVNATFARAFPENDDMHRGQVRFTDAVAVRPAPDTPAVACHGFEGDSALQDEVEFVCELLRGGIEDRDCHSIALLGRSRSQLRPFTRALRQRGIDYSAQDLETLGDSPVVLDLITLCRALANPADRVAWLALSRAPWCGLRLADLHRVGSWGERGIRQAPADLFSDPGMLEGLSADGRERLQHLQRVLQLAESTRDRLALRVWIEQVWLALCGPATASYPSQLRDAERFFQLLEHAEREGLGLDLRWLQRQVDSLKLGEEQPDSKLQVMTLHKAKGLEFDWVVIPCLSRLTRSDARSLLLWDEYTDAEGARGFLLAADDHSQEKDRTLYNYLRQQRKQKTLLENTRLLYVGATRAIQRLWLTAAVKPAEAEGEWKDPPTSSLLAAVWNAFREQCMVHRPGAAAVVDEPQARPLRRLQAIPADRPAPASDAPVEDPNIPERAANRLERHVGTVVHLALEELSRREALPEGPGDVDLLRWGMALRRLGVCGDDLEQARAAVADSLQATLADPRGRWILSSDHREARSEYALTRAAHAGAFQDLVIDRTFVDAATGERWIVDYKTSRPAQGEGVDDFLQREALAYHDQLVAYRGAMAALKPEPVRCALYFTALPAFHELEFE